MWPSIIRAVTFSKEAENANFYGQCPGGGGSDDAFRSGGQKRLEW